PSSRPADQACMLLGESVGKGIGGRMGGQARGPMGSFRNGREASRKRKPHWRYGAGDFGFVSLASIGFVSKSVSIGRLLETKTAAADRAFSCKIVHGNPTAKRWALRGARPNVHGSTT